MMSAPEELSDVSVLKIVREAIDKSVLLKTSVELSVKRVGYARWALEILSDSIVEGLSYKTFRGVDNFGRPWAVKIEGL